MKLEIDLKDKDSCVWCPCFDSMVENKRHFCCFYDEYIIGSNYIAGAPYVRPDKCKEDNGL
jgi:hypothetical protein